MRRSVRGKPWTVRTRVAGYVARDVGSHLGAGAAPSGGQPALAHEGDVVLLAPACSSYDQYPNYLRRGEDFKRVVHEVLA